jgi:hypothetical protein
VFRDSGSIELKYERQVLGHKKHRTQKAQDTKSTGHKKHRTQKAQATKSIGHNG